MWSPAFCGCPSIQQCCIYFKYVYAELQRAGMCVAGSESQHSLDASAGGAAPLHYAAAHHLLIQLSARFCRASMPVVKGVVLSHRIWIQALGGRLSRRRSTPSSRSSASPGPSNPSLPSGSAAGPCAGSPATTGSGAAPPTSPPSPPCTTPPWLPCWRPPRSSMPRRMQQPWPRCR